MAANPENRMELPIKITNDRNLPVLPSPPPLLLNGFKMDLSKIVAKAHLFNLQFVAVFEREKEKEQTREERPLAEGDKNDIDAQIRRRLHWHLFELLFQLHPNIFSPQHRHEFLYDCSKLMFCTIDLGLSPGAEKKFQIGQQHLNGLPPELRSHFAIRNAGLIVAVLQKTDLTLNLRSRTQSMADGGIILTQLLEILTSQSIFQRDQHLVFGNEMFNQQQGQMAIQNLAEYVLKEGLQKNVRLVWDSEKPVRPILQIRPKKSAFFAEIGVDEFFGRHLRVNRQNLGRQLENGWDRANKQIKGLMVITTHMPENQLTFKTAGITRERADNLRFQHQGQMVNVPQYMQQRYGLGIDASLPCVIRNFRGQESHYPLEVLKILPGQRVKLEKQTPELVQQMIRQCQILPVEMGNQIQQQMAQTALDDANPFLRAYEIRVEAELIRANQSHRLLPPAIQYDPPQAKIEPNNRGDLDWRTRGARFIHPTPLFPAREEFAVAMYDVRNFSLDDCRQFVDRLVHEARGKGIQNAERPIIIETWESRGRLLVDYVKEQHDRLYKIGIQFLLLIAPGKNTAHKGDIHHCVKLVETVNQMLTQHIAPETARKFMSQGGGTTVENILMKMNMKMDGANYDLVAPRGLSQVRNHDIVKQEWLRAGRMFFGLEFSHAPPNAPRSRTNRKGKKVPAIPTIVGMAWTIGDDFILRMRGTYWTQTPRLAIANAEECRPLIDNFKKALWQYHEVNGRYPEQIFVFRGGASEGEFKKVAYWEGQQSFERALQELRKEPAGGDFPPLQGNPLVLIVVCQAKSNYRIVPINANPRDRAPQQNVQPGTILEEFTHPTLTEFLLVAQKALQGTAQPIRCTVVYPPFKNAQNPPVPLLELEYLTYHLCYSHGICTGSIAVPGPLKAAAELAKRGKNNWDTRPDLHQLDFDYPDTEDEEEAQRQFDNELDGVFSQISAEIEPAIPTKFWA